MDYHGKPYYSLDAWCKNTYGEKLYKIALDAGLTCPNRDGTLDSRGCIFCSAGGSGEFAAGRLPGAEPVDGPFSIREQLEAGKKLLEKKKTGRRYIAYFQAYTNTYGPVDYLASIYRQALMEPDIAGISIATRPDCLGTEIMRLFASLKQDFRINSSGLSWDFRRSTKKRLCLSAEDIPFPVLPKRWKLFIKRIFL